MANTPAWFDEVYYLNSKLAQLRANGETQYKTITDVKIALDRAGITPFDHFQQYSLQEKTSPNQYFNAQEYLAAKARQLNADPDKVRTWTPDDVQYAIGNAGMTLWQHFQNYGWTEKVNPSNAFDVQKYLEAKAAQLGGDWTADKVAEAFVANNLSPLEHYLQYGKGEGLQVVPATDPVTPDNPTGNMFPLTPGADNHMGTAGDDIFDGSANTTTTTPNTLNPFDTINGGEGRDTIIVAQNVVDVDFSGVTSVERIVTNGTNITLGAQAQRAGIDTVVNTNTAAATLTLGAGYTRDNGHYTLGVSSVDTVLLNNQAANTNYRVTLSSAEVGNGSVNESGAVEGQDGDLAVRLQKEDAGGDVTGGVGRFSDEGVSLVSSDATVRFDVRELDGTQRGTFQQVTLGTAAGEALAVNNSANVSVLAAGAGVYIDGGAGNDTITGSANADFLIGGEGDDSITTGGGNDTILGGAGNDTITKTVGGRINADGGVGDDTFVMTGQLQAVGLAATRDTIAGGEGRDTLVANIADFQAATATVAGEAAVITGIEVLRVADAFAGTLTTKNVQQGIEAVQLAAGGAGMVNFEAGARTVQVGVAGIAAQLTGALVAVAAGTAGDDALTVTNGLNAAAGKNNTFNGQNITATGYEAVTINTGASNVSGAQTLGTVTVNASAMGTATSLALAGANALSLTAATNSTGVFTIDASGLAAQPGANTTLTLNVTAGATTGANVTGSAGRDAITLNAGNNVVNSGAGNDTITAGTGKDNINAGAGDDVVVMGANLTAADTVDGGEGRDTLAVSAAVTAAAQTGVTGFEILRLDGTADQNMAIFVNNTTFDTVALNSAAGNHNISNAGTAIANLRIDQNVGNVTFNNLVNTGSNTLNLFAGADTNVTVTKLTLHGIDGKATDGIDTLTISQGAANVTAGKAFTVTTLEANDLDTLTITGAQNTTIGTLTNNGGTARNVTIDASGATGTVTIGNTANNSNVNYNFTGSATAVNTFGGSAGNDTITGGAADDILAGGAGRDVINGGAGNDVITGGAGADRMTGGTGNDTFVISSRADSRDLTAFNTANTTNANIDHITDFAGNGAAAGDTIQLSTDSNVYGVALQFSSGIGGTVANVTAVSFAAADSFAQLETLLGNQTGSSAGIAQIIDLTIASGSLAGRYVIVNDEVAATDFTLDTIINITGATGALNAQDFTFI